MTTLMRELRAH